MALTEKQYLHMKNCGVDGVITWQETYDEDLYYKSIKSGPKAYGIDDNFKVVKKGDGYNFRLNSQERAISAGLQVGIGAMIGLNPNLNFEVLSTLAHARYLIDKHSNKPHKPVIIGMPTWNNLTTKKTDNKTDGNNVDLERIFPYISCLYLLGSPKGKVWIFPNCRVSMQTQVKSIVTSGYFTSTEVSVAPGGYTEKSNQILSQFVHHFDLHENYMIEFKKHGIHQDNG
jgi:hypothetical protein